MRWSLFLGLGLLVWGCGSNGDSAGLVGNGGSTSGGAASGGGEADSAGMGGVTGDGGRGEIGAPLQIAPGQASLLGVTSDGWVIFREADLLRGAKLGDAEQIQDISDHPGSVLIRGRVVFNWADIDWTVGMGKLSVWTADAGAHTVGLAPYVEALTSASEDGSTIVYTRNNHEVGDGSGGAGGAASASMGGAGGAGGSGTAPEKATDLMIASSDLSSSEVLVESMGIGSEATCGASLGFVGERLFVGWCSPGSRAAKIERYELADATWTPTTIADDTLSAWSADAMGERVFYQSSGYSGYVTDSGNPILIDAGVSQGTLLPDGSAVLYSVGDQLRRVALPDVNPVAIITTGYKQPVGFSSDYAFSLYSTTVSYEHGTQRDLLLTSTDVFNPNPLVLVKQPVATLARSSMTRDGRFVLYLTDVTDRGGTLHVVDPDGREVATLPGVVEASAAKGSLLVFTDNSSDPSKYPVVADLKLIDLERDSEPRLIEQQVLSSKDFQVDVSGSTVAYVRSGVDRDAEQPDHDGLFVVSID
jgi:hypothetical protein